MINIATLSKIVNNNSTGKKVSFDEMIAKLKDGTYTKEDAANFIASNKILNRPFIGKLLNKASELISKVGLNEVIENPKTFAEDMFALALVVFYLYFSSTPSLTKIHGQDPERAARGLVNAYSLYVGRRRGTKAQINPAFSGPIEASTEKENLPYERGYMNEAKLNKLLKVLITEQVAELDSQPAPPDMVGEPDYEGGMARNELKTAARDAMALVQRLQESDQLPAWCQSKITLASEYIQTVKEFLESEVSDEEPEEV